MLRRTLLFFSGLVPSLFVSYHSAPLFAMGVDALFDGEYLFGSTALAVTCACMYGTYSLAAGIIVAHRPLDFAGLLAGTTAMLAMIASPFVQFLLEKFGFYECRFNSGRDCYGATVFFAFYALIALPVFAGMTVWAWKQRKTRTFQDQLN